MRFNDSFGMNLHFVIIRCAGTYIFFDFLETFYLLAFDSFPFKHCVDIFGSICNEYMDLII